MGEAVPPFGVRDAVVIDRPSRYRGLRVTAVAFAGRTPRIRAYLHTPGWGRIVATGTGTSAGDAATRAEDLLDRALSQGVVVGPVPWAPAALRRAGLLHDLGKLGVPNRVLDKPGKLTPEEWALMRRHPAYTAEVLARVECLRTVAGTAASHHERLDGSGYHRGLDASVLRLPARILAVADVYAALANDRPYHAAMPTERAFAILDADAGTRLDRESIAALHRLLDGVAVDLAA